MILIVILLQLAAEPVIQNSHLAMDAIKSGVQAIRIILMFPPAILITLLLFVIYMFKSPERGQIF